MSYIIPKVVFPLFYPTRTPFIFHTPHRQAQDTYQPFEASLDFLVDEVWDSGPGGRHLRQPLGVTVALVLGVGSWVLGVGGCGCGCGCCCCFPRLATFFFARVKWLATLKYGMV